MEPEYYEKEYTVHVYETAPDGNLNIWSLFNFMQDIASEHAVKLGFGREDLMKDNNFWVLSRIYALIDRMPPLYETVTMRTWPNGTDKLFALRNFEATDSKGNHIASGTSSWLILDRNSKKIQRPDTALTHFKRNPVKGESPVRFAEKLDPVAEGAVIWPPYRIKVSDIDVNIHTNNVQYLKWICDTYGIDFVMKNVPRSVEINYLAESVFDEEIEVKTSGFDDEKMIHMHSVFRKNDNRELCRIRLEWTKAPASQTNG